ncbi:hypothetical protein AVEN_168786-1 [Araneus ventricosus]|uniref:Integrase p58-like C-terminal domain-containing protein n=1 Tax=Araneus ventricosus TaxID=182803 RepID=A0A4Y2K8H9_ARAVE|nr:hypothetical protein AVEN_168786-1 [Araneus ventricosus]
MTTEGRWSLSEIQKAQLEDPDIRPILKMKLNSAVQPSWQKITRESPATKRYWTLWNSLYLKDDFPVTFSLEDRGILLPRRLIESRLESVQASAEEQVKLLRERMKTRYDSRATYHDFKVGDLVSMYNPKRQRGLSPKLQQNWEGPYTVVKKMNDAVYRVQRFPNAKPKVIHINRLDPYRATDHSSI